MAKPAVPIICWRLAMAKPAIAVFAIAGNLEACCFIFQIAIPMRMKEMIIVNIMAIATM